VLLHEVGHAHGYNHPRARDFTGNPREYDHSVNEQIEECAFRAGMTDDPVSAHGRPRSSLTAETTLSKVGGLGGLPFEVACPAGQYGFGLDLRAGERVDNIGLRCRAPTTGLLGISATSGGSGGQAHVLECYPGEYLVGLHGRAGLEVDQVGPICASDWTVRNAGSDVFRDPGFGGGGGLPWDRQCPPYMVLRALRGRSGERIDQLELDCKRLDSSEPVRLTSLDRIGITTAPGIRRVSLERCAGRSALIGLTHSADSWVHRLGGVCGQIATRSFLGVVTDSLSTTQDPHLLSSNGSGVGLPGEILCGAGEAVVGLAYRAGTVIDAIAPVCAAVTAWSSPLFSAPLHEPGTDFGWAGGIGGAPGRRYCPRGSFLVGWQIDHGTEVLSIVPQCRDF
jgi:hypothetical protein